MEENEIRISEFNRATTTNDSDLIPIVQSNETRAITKEDFQRSLQPVILYDNSTGSNSTITLSDNVNNYSYIEIFYHSNDDYVGSKKIKAENSYADLIAYQNQTINENAFYIKTRIISINNNTISTRQGSDGYYAKEVFFSTNGYSQNGNNYIYITRVLGYK